MLTEKQNYLRMLSGEQPEYVPQYTFGQMPGEKKLVATQMFEPPVISQHRKNNGGKDIWGVNYVATYETGNAILPEPNNFILADITKWRDVIRAPSLDGVDWEKMVKDDMEKTGIDRSQTALALNLHMGYFQTLMSFMGFSEGLMAMFEEPDEVKALLTYICDFYMDVADRCIDLYRPDVLTFMDDTAAWGGPFISAEMYEEFLVPCHDRWAKRGRDRGLKMTMHNCGKCEGILDLLVGMGIHMWEPAQTCNDLKAVKAKYGNKLAIAGGWDAKEHLLDPDVTAEALYASVDETFDMLAPGGGFAWCGGFLGPVGNAAVDRKNDILNRYVTEKCRGYYKS
ncbi:Uroporphyrinogen decarboxylase (URO-D) [Sporobacter termitidis DSM 10068]|uniref:Uroporphyrinogen decarboxylase (URO-D) n=1 Tax=Sporobacter termitidis DSM 10068 TaxID=1123282 RepID=A0A1M5UR39_9FIRM|nr:uroporphyrinogen decarboxylase family protein [Sporobacter termitidis]SHH65173.1 Uroporphyrinogen decarboxylase (URO-D) [Sporobacter termitidis DSM 10068]